jgi:glycosyltransferase involved in cell wall biosynthesis
MPRVVVFVELSPYPSYGGSKRVITQILSGLDRERWAPQVIFHAEGAFADDARRLGVPVRVIAADRPSDANDDEHADQPPASEPKGSVRSTRPISVAPGLWGVRRTPQGEVIRLGPRRLLWEARAWHRLLIRDRREGQRLRALLPERVDIIHINAALHTGYAWFHVAQACGIPFVTHEHGIWSQPPSAWRVVARRAAAVLCLTPERVEQVHRFAGDSVRAEYLPNGVSLERFARPRPRREVREALGVGPDELLLITAGHIQPWKGQHLALEAAARLRDAGLRFQWILCGRQLDAGYAAALEATVVSSRLSDRVKFLGERPDLLDLFAAADLAIHTSVHPEPFGLVVIEAMAAGAPVVGPAEGAIPMILGHGDAGRLYTPRDAASLTDTVLAFARDAEARRVAGERARQRVADQFQADAQVRRLMAIYDRAVATLITARSLVLMAGWIGCGTLLS